MAFCWVRLFGVYGPGEASHRLIPYLVTRLRNNEVVDLTPGRQVRDLMFIDDAVRGLISAANAALEGHEGPFNLCSGQGTEIGEIARMIANLLGKPAGLLAFGAREYRPDEPLWLVGSPESFHRISLFTPKVDVPTGIRATLASI
jgi:nucleoside-diphosphate-sugar epimerase